MRDFSHLAWCPERADQFANGYLSPENYEMKNMA